MTFLIAPRNADPAFRPRRTRSCQNVHKRPASSGAAYHAVVQVTGNTGPPANQQVVVPGVMAHAAGIDSAEILDHRYYPIWRVHGQRQHKIVQCRAEELSRQKYPGHEIQQPMAVGAPAGPTDQQRRFLNHDAVGARMMQRIVVNSRIAEPPQCCIGNVDEFANKPSPSEQVPTAADLKIAQERATNRTRANIQTFRSDFQVSFGASRSTW